MAPPSKEQDANILPSFENSTWFMEYVCPSKGEQVNSSMLLFSPTILNSFTNLSLHNRQNHKNAAQDINALP